jgi:hypothetical protein
VRGRSRYVRSALIVGTVLSLAQVPFAPSPGWQFADACIAAVFALTAWYGYRVGRL